MLRRATLSLYLSDIHVGLGGRLACAGFPTATQHTGAAYMDMACTWIVVITGKDGALEAFAFQRGPSAANITRKETRAI